MQPNKIPMGDRKKGCPAFTLMEVVMALSISATVFGGILVGHTVTCRRAEWTGYSLAAQALGVQQIEQARAAVWYPSVTNEVLNLNLLNLTSSGGVTNRVTTGYSINTLDIPVSGTNNIVYATNFVTIRMIRLNNASIPPVFVQMVQVDTVWPFKAGKAVRIFTNTIATYLAPDNRDPDDL
jgi:hypothetical protein